MTLLQLFFPLLQVASMRLLVLVVTALLTGFVAPAEAAPRQEATLLNATQVLSEMQNAPDQRVPNWLLERAYGVAVIPNVVKAGLILGGRRGSGVLVVRQPDLTWSNPVFINITGVSLGLQWGVQSSDLILVFVSKESIEGIMGGKVTLGADASVAAGPVGRQASAATDINLTAQVYAYSRNKGLFLGVALDGSGITIGRKDNAEYYNKPGILASEIIDTKAPHANAQAAQFITQLNAQGGAAPKATNAPNTAPTNTANGGTPVTTAPVNNEPSGLVTYPMEDTHVGSEPPP